jgi:hypothetical protein
MRWRCLHSILAPGTAPGDISRDLTLFDKCAELITSQKQEPFVSGRGHHCFETLAMKRM